MKKFDTWEIIGDLLLIAFGIVLIFIFVQIEVLGVYGMEENALIRRIELIFGIPLIVLGVERFIKDLRI